MFDSGLASPLFVCLIWSIALGGIFWRYELARAPKTVLAALTTLAAGTALQMLGESAPFETVAPLLVLLPILEELVKAAGLYALRQPSAALAFGLVYGTAEQALKGSIAFRNCSAASGCNYLADVSITYLLAFYIAAPMAVLAMHVWTLGRMSDAFESGRPRRIAKSFVIVCAIHVAFNIANVTLLGALPAFLYLLVFAAAAWLWRRLRRRRIANLDAPPAAVQ